MNPHGIHADAEKLLPGKVIRRNHGIGMPIDFVADARLVPEAICLRNLFAVGIDLIGNSQRLPYPHADHALGEQIPGVHKVNIERTRHAQSSEVERYHARNALYFPVREGGRPPNDPEAGTRF
jgi:hypothetical protein